MAREKKSAKLENIVGWLETHIKMMLSSGLITNIADDLSEEFDVKVYTGQKRTVALVDSYVIKTVNTREGLDDNINDILTSNRLRELQEKGKIKEKDLDLFVISEMVSEDPFVIKAPRVNLIKDTPEFKEWYNENKNSSALHDCTKNYAIAYYILQDKKFNKQLYRIQEIISKFFVGSDILWKTIENYGVTDDGDLALLDLGSILPKYKGTKVMCEECGREKNLLIVEVDYRKADDIEEAMLLKTGLYGCTNEDCVDYADNIKTIKRSNNCTDSVVFDEYLSDVSTDQVFIKDVAEQCYIYFPTVEIESFDDFKDSLLEDSGEKFDAEDIRRIWLNSLPYLISDKVDDCEDEIENNVIEEEYEDFDEFKEMIYDETDEDDEIIDIYAVIMYLKYNILEEGSKISMFTILDSEDKSEFMSYLKDLEEIDEDDYDDMWEIVSTFIKKKGRK